MNDSAVGSSFIPILRHDTWCINVVLRKPNTSLIMVIFLTCCAADVPGEEGRTRVARVEAPMGPLRTACEGREKFQSMSTSANRNCCHCGFIYIPYGWTASGTLYIYKGSITAVSRIAFIQKSLSGTIYADSVGACKSMASQKDNVKRPKCHLPHKQRAPRKPCRRSAICKTTSQCSSCHTSLLDVAIFPFCWHSS